MFLANSNIFIFISNYIFMIIKLHWKNDIKIEETKWITQFILNYYVFKKNRNFKIK